MGVSWSSTPRLVPSVCWINTQNPSCECSYTPCIFAQPVWRNPKLSVKRLSERPAALPLSCTRSARYIEPRSYPASGARTRYGEQEIHKVTWLSLSPASVAARSISRSWWVSWLVSQEVVCYIVSCEWGVPCLRFGVHVFMHGEWWCQTDV